MSQKAESASVNQEKFNINNCNLVEGDELLKRGQRRAFMKGSRRNGCRKAATTSRLGESGQGETQDRGSIPHPALSPSPG